jgi:glycosyltransferase involved in cell wall biosynthesis
MRIALVTDAWAPQVNGVVRTLQETVLRLVADGHAVDVIAPDSFATLPCPTYPEIRLALFARRKVRRRLAEFAPDCVHIATEGPLGIVARKACLDWGWSFTTAFHTRFADYAAARTGIDAARFWRYLRWFHGPARSVMAATDDLRAELASHGLTRSHRWSRGVDMNRFSPDLPTHPELVGLPRPLLLSVGRVAVEKNLEAFLSLPTVGTKVVVGDGPALSALRAAYPQAIFLGARVGQTLAQAYTSADVFVFPSKTDTFGLVMIEALASGTPVAAYPVTGPLAVFGENCPAVALDADLPMAVERALKIDPAVCVSEARRFDWSAATGQFLAGLVPVRSASQLVAA